MWTGLGLLSNDRVSVPSALEHEIPRIIEVLVVMKLTSQTKSYGNASQKVIFFDDRIVEVKINAKKRGSSLSITCYWYLTFPIHARSIRSAL